MFLSIARRWITSSLKKGGVAVQSKRNFVSINRKCGRITSDSAYDWRLFMSYAYPIIGKISDSRDYYLREDKDFVPEMRGNINSAEDFLNAIGRNCNEYTSAFEDWESLFKFKLDQAKDMGIDFKRARYITRWTEKYKRGLNPMPFPDRKKTRGAKNKISFRIPTNTTKLLKYSPVLNEEGSRESLL